MNVFLCILITVITFCFMEVVAWLTHKYIMHGLFWYLHEDHHQPKYESFFEKNDWFFLIFATPSMTFYYLGTVDGINYLFFIGLGIQLYGFAYFLVHDVLIHRRFNWFEKTENKYLRALRKAHKVHHKHLGKEDGECFGMLFVPLKYFRESGFLDKKDGK